MMISSLLRILGKEEVNIDKRIPLSYVLRLGIRYGMMCIRGVVRMPILRSTSIVLLGKRVRMVCTRQLELGKGVRLNDGVWIDALSRNGVHLGDGVLIGRNGRIECTGSVSHIGKGISIGPRTTFGADCYFGAAGGITIGSDVIAGQNIRFHSENHLFARTDVLIRKQGVTQKGIRVGSNCWIGAGAVFLDGAEVGDGCVVAANAVVTRQFPDNVVIGGVPARVLKPRA